MSRLQSLIKFPWVNVNSCVVVLRRFMAPEKEEPLVRGFWANHNLSMYQSQTSLESPTEILVSSLGESEGCKDVSPYSSTSGNLMYEAEAPLSPLALCLIEHAGFAPRAPLSWGCVSAEQRGVHPRQALLRTHTARSYGQGLGEMGGPN